MAQPDTESAWQFLNEGRRVASADFPAQAFY
jgi:hypothetical protein